MPVTLTGSDIEPGPLTYSLGRPARRTARSAGRCRTSPTRRRPTTTAPTASIFRVTDSVGRQRHRPTIDITVNSVNDAADDRECVGRHAAGHRGHVTIVANDLDGDTLTYTPTTPTAGGGTVVLRRQRLHLHAGHRLRRHRLASRASSTTATAAPPLDCDSERLGRQQHAAGRSTTRRTSCSRTRPGPSRLASTDADGDPLTYSVAVPPADGIADLLAGRRLHLHARRQRRRRPRPPSSRSPTVAAGIDNATITFSIVPSNDAPGRHARQPRSPTRTRPVRSTLSANDADRRHAHLGREAGADQRLGQLHRRWRLHLHAERQLQRRRLVRGRSRRRPRRAGAHHRAGHRHPGQRPADRRHVSRVVIEDGSTTLQPGRRRHRRRPVTFVGRHRPSSATLNCSGGVAPAPSPATPTPTAPRPSATPSATARRRPPARSVITIAPVNDAPTAANVTLGTPEDTPLSRSRWPATDVDAGDTAHLQRSPARPARALCRAHAPNLTYTPGAQRQWRRHASGTASPTRPAPPSTGTVTITVSPVERPAGRQLGRRRRPPRTRPRPSPSPGSDVEGPVTVAVTAAPAHGTYAGGTYTPAAQLLRPRLDRVPRHRQRRPDRQRHDRRSRSRRSTTHRWPPTRTVATTRTVPIPITLGAHRPRRAARSPSRSSPARPRAHCPAPRRTCTYTPTGFNTGADVFTYRVTDPAGLTTAPRSNITIIAGLGARHHADRRTGHGDQARG